MTQERAGASVEEQVEAALDEAEPEMPLVGIIAEEPSDMDVMDGAAAVLREAGIPHEVRVLSALRRPDQVADYCRNASMRGLRVLVAGAGLGCSLPGIAAAHTRLPVVAVPLSHRRSVLGGLDALLGATQLPAGVPVAAVGLDDATNAGHLAARILGAA